MHHPIGGRSAENIALYKVSDHLVLLYSGEGNPRKLTDGIEFTVPAAARVSPHVYVLLVGYQLTL